MNVPGSVINNPIVVFGAGSIGERHIGVLQKLGFTQILVFRKRSLPMRNIDPASVTILHSLEQVLAAKPYAAIICTPTSQHAEQTAFCMEHGIHVLVEKPLASNLADKDLLLKIARKSGSFVQIGYMLRYHPFFKEVKQLIESEKFGKLISFQTYWGEYLPNWHPWEDYRTSYAATASMGGGAALTLSHDVDLILWLVSQPIALHYAIKNTAFPLEVDVEGGFDLLLKFKNGTTGHVHTNFYQQTAQREYKFVFENALLVIDYLAATITITFNNKTTVEKLANFDRNQMFEEQTTAFFEATVSSKAGAANENLLAAFDVINLCI